MKARNDTLMGHINAFEREHFMLQKTLLRMLSDQNKWTKMVLRNKYAEKQQKFKIHDENQR